MNEPRVSDYQRALTALTGLGLSARERGSARRLKAALSGGDMGDLLAATINAEFEIGRKAFDPNEPRDAHGRWSRINEPSGWGDLADIPPLESSPPTVGRRDTYRHEADAPVPGPDAPSLDALPTDAYANPDKYMDQFNPALGTAYHGTSAYKETLAAIEKARGNPDATVKIYRGGVPAGNGINRGDWVTLSRRYAEVIRELRGGEIVSALVPAKTVHWGGKDLNEMAFHGPAPKTRQSS